ncbi:MAG: DNA-3-methyladenine glycosylase III [Candidatus Electronema aureum]|uniref:DNA-3-methyladenine glycosylase III n=1 Tax=Candidatus Electronema aureum TaxID=2005002 RepID=A0A521G3E6_9BACT|nr:MAG: DNA-3-methyladenine glycosylase III [Candidatus Electronema aureum]
MRASAALQEIYNRLLAHFGPQHWWPGDSPFEVMIGAVLTQNTNWCNVEKAIANLKAAELLSPAALSALPLETLAEYIRPAGYHNLKAARLKNLLALIKEQGGVEDLLNQPTTALRELLLAVKGIGPETADSIVLYAASKPIFVVDTYTNRILMRHELISEDSDYFQIQDLFMDNLKEDVALFNEYHALLVRVGKKFCGKSKPKCEDCPLNRLGKS